MELIIYIAVFLIVLGAKIKIDINRKNDGIIINHTLSWWLVFTINLAAALLLFWGDWQFIIGLGFIASGVFWILFDVIFGKINWNDWHFHGTSSWVDRWLVSLGKWHFLIKIGVVLVGILINFL